MNKKTIDLGPQYRSMEGSIKLRAHDPADQDGIERAEVSFSSETPVERFGYTEILGHGIDEIRRGRLDSGSLAVLREHNSSRHIGAVEKGSVSFVDGVGRAVLILGTSEEAKATVRDIRDGILQNVSVRYQIHKLSLIEESDDGDVYRVKDWEPLEISFVAIPADPSVGLGRSDDGDLVKTITIETPSTPPAPANPKEGKRTMDPITETPAVSPAAPIASPAAPDLKQVTANEKSRVQEILTLGVKYEVEEKLVNQAIADGGSVGEFSRSILSTLDTQKKPTPSGVGEPIGLNDKEIKKFDLMRALRAVTMPSPAYREEAAFEIECSRACEEKRKEAPRGIYIPPDIFGYASQSAQRDLSVGTATAGGHLVPTILDASSFIDVLRNRMISMRAGAVVLAGLEGSLAIPRQTGGATAYHVAEAVAITESQQAVDQVTLTATTVGAFTDYSRRLLLQSSIDVENFVRNDLAATLALAIDLGALYGSGSAGQPTGVVNTTGINALTLVGLGDPTWAEVVEVETLVMADNADIGTMHYIMDPAFRGALKVKEKGSGTAKFIWDEGGLVNEYLPLVSNQMTANDLLFGNFADLIIGMWSGLDITLDPYALSTAGGTRIVALQDYDIAVRHEESFCLADGGT